MSLCLSAGGVTLALALETFSLSWTHSVERTVWREEWRITEAGLIIESAAISGSGAGMEVPDGAVLRDGAWHYRPALPPLTEVVFADAGGEAGDWRICDDAVCRNVGDLVPSRGSRLTLSSCEQVGVGLSKVPPPHDYTR